MTDGYSIISHRHVKSAVAVAYYSMNNDLSATENLVSLPIAANTARKMFVRVWACSMIDADTLPVPCVFTLMKNGVATALTVSVDAVGTFSVTEDVAFDDEDTFSIKIDPRNDYYSGSITFQVVLCFLLP